MKWLFLLLLVPLATAFDSGDIDVGESWSKTFDEEHEGYTYHCHPHPWMTAMVHVNADSDQEVTTHLVDIVEGETADEWGYSVEHLVVEVGDTVTWTNEGTMIHTVTVTEGEHNHEGDHDHDHGDHSHEEESPGLPIAFSALALLFIALARRK